MFGMPWYVITMSAFVDWLDICVFLYAPTDHCELSSNQAAQLWRTGPGVEVQILPHHAGEGGCVCSAPIPTQVSVSVLTDSNTVSLLVPVDTIFHVFTAFSSSSHHRPWQSSSSVWTGICPRRPSRLWSCWASGGRWMWRTPWSCCHPSSPTPRSDATLWPACSRQMMR